MERVNFLEFLHRPGIRELVKSPYVKVFYSLTYEEKHRQITYIDNWHIDIRYEGSAIDYRFTLANFMTHIHISKIEIFGRKVLITTEMNR